MSDIAISCLVQWYEYEIVKEYVESLLQSLDYWGESKDFVTVDFCIYADQKFEKCVSDELFTSSLDSIYTTINKLEGHCKKLEIKEEYNYYSIARYRRDFNSKYCNRVSILVWGEADCLLPKQFFNLISIINNSAKNQNVYKFILTFAICKMWDNSWKNLEHPLFTDKDSKKEEEWWGTKYTMSLDEMNKINYEIDTIEVKLIEPIKFNGCGLVFSSDIVNCGVNIPESIFFMHDDSAFLEVLKRCLPNCPQYHVSNILLVHNRKHPKKRMNILGEEGVKDSRNVGQMRSKHEWYKKMFEYSSSNLKNLFNINYKSYSVKNFKELLP